MKLNICVILATSAVVGAISANSCCFQVYASDSEGHVRGLVGQLGDGQNRVGGGYPPATYCIESGSIIDANDRGCILTPETQQWQCDTGATPSSGFSIEQGGALHYKGNGTFYACPYNSVNGHNVYAEPLRGQRACRELNLTTFLGRCSPSTVKETGTKTTEAPTAVPTTSEGPLIVSTITRDVTVTITRTHFLEPSSTCICPEPAPCKNDKHDGGNLRRGISEQSTANVIPLNSSPDAVHLFNSPDCLPATGLTAEFQYPHQICMFDQQKKKSLGCTNEPLLSKNSSSVFTFDIPKSWAFRTCSLVFLMPSRATHNALPFARSGHGYVRAHLLSKPVDASFTFANLPSVAYDLMEIPGQNFKLSHRYTLEQRICPAGERVSYMLTTTGNYSLRYFQEFNPAPVGMFINSC